MISEESGQGGQGGHKLTGHSDVTGSAEGEQRGIRGRYHDSERPRLSPHSAGLQSPGSQDRDTAGLQTGCR